MAYIGSQDYLLINMSMDQLIGMKYILIWSCYI